MDKKRIISAALEVDRLVLESRLRDLAIVAQTDRSDRVKNIAAVVSRLDPGAYLIGCGPYNCGVLPLTVNEVVLGRPPSPLEQLPETVADFTLNDAVWMVPREASRIHASIVRRVANEVVTFWARDKKSTTGTYVNGQQVEAADDDSGTSRDMELSNGDVVSLGPSGVNCYVFYVAE